MPALPRTPDEVAGSQKLVYAIQHVKVHDANRGKAAPFSEPSKRCRRMSVCVEREKGVTVHIRHILFRFEWDFPLLRQSNQFRQRVEANVAAKNR